jgi:hypothetical protein
MMLAFCSCREDERFYLGVVSVFRALADSVCRKSLSLRYVDVNAEEKSIPIGTTISVPCRGGYLGIAEVSCQTDGSLQYLQGCGEL